MMTITEINAALADRIADLAPALLGPPNPALSSRRQLRYGRKGSLVVEISGPKRGCWFSHELGAGGDPLGLVQHAIGRHGALAWARQFLGTVPPVRTYKVNSGTATKNNSPEKSEKKRWSEQAQGLWASYKQPEDTPAEIYLRSRGCWVPGLNDLRFGEWRGRPALVARITDAITAEPLSLHFTLLKSDGSGKADVERPKLFLPGHVTKGGVVRLVDDTEVTLGLALGEGLETCASAIAEGWWPVWATLSAGNMGSFPVLNGVEALTAFADNDESGAGQRAAEKVVRRWRAAGREARIVLPPEVGTDWNDVMREDA